MAHPTDDRRRTYDRWVTLPFSAAAVASSLVAFSAKGLLGASLLYGSQKVTSIVDATVLSSGVLVLIASWVVLWASSRRGHKH